MVNETSDRVRDALAALPSDYVLFGEEQRDSSTTFRLLKPPYLVAGYLDVARELQRAKVVEVGVYKGGSTVFLAELLQPSKLVAVELETKPVGVLDDYVRDHGLEQIVRVHYGVDQSDRSTVSRIIDEEFGAEPLDLVIDDASHLLAETTATMEVLFPRLRPGGLYIIEDWSANLAIAHNRSEALARGDDIRDMASFEAALARRLSSSPELLDQMVASPEFERRLQAMDTDGSGSADGDGSTGALPESVEASDAAPAAPPRPGDGELSDGLDNGQMWRLIVDLLSIVATTTDVIDDLHIGRGMVTVRRGSAPLDAESFRLVALSHLATTGFSREATT